METNTNTPEAKQTASAVCHPTTCSSSCECRDWCRDGRDMMSLHHPRCEHYTPPPVDPRFARFGEAVWMRIVKLGGEYCWSEDSENILPLAEAAGLCCRVKYNPEIHGEAIEAERGDEIWWWGDFDWMNVELIHGGEGSPNSNWSVTRRWMERLVRFPF